MIKKNKKRVQECLEPIGDDQILGDSSLTDSDDDDAGLLTWAASLEKDHATQVSNLESERQLTTTVDNTVDGLALHADSQATEDDNLNFPKKNKKIPHSLLLFQEFRPGCEVLLLP